MRPGSLRPDRLRCPRGRLRDRGCDHDRDPGRAASRSRRSPSCSSLLFSSEAYTAGGKLTKPAWCAILGLGLAAQLLLITSPLNILHLAFTIAAFVYLADVRPPCGLTRR